MDFQEYAESARSRLHLGRVTPQTMVGIAAIGVAAAVALAAGIGPLVDAQPVEVVEAHAAESGSEGSAAEAEPASIFVHVAGCVEAPGVYELAEGARIADAVAAAGGFTADASDGALNLARVLADGEQVLIPSIEQAQAPAAVGSAGVQASGTQAAAASGKVNINTADAAQLQTISGIGASKAQKIIAYREANGSFKSVDDIVSVSGIGEKTLEAIRDQICV